MCGIAGIYDLNGRMTMDESVIRSMTKSLAHRGPDDEGIFLDGSRKMALGHRRLSIIDLQGGHQPMSDSDGKIHIVFNGEIYNFKELRQSLAALGHRFKTTSDTEVILYVYKEYGVKGFKKLNGMFAFGLYDGRDGSMVLARDPFGVKPLYYLAEETVLVFASEIKAVFKRPGFRRELDYEAFNSFLTFRYNPSPQTLIQGIRKLPPGHYLRMDAKGQKELVDFWQPRPRVNKIGEDEAVNEYARLLEQAVVRQMVSDVPVGLFLSGGIDSAVIGHLMQKHSRSPIQTFTVGFPGQGNFNELADARQSAQLIGSNHRQIEIGQKEYLEFFFKSFAYTEEPMAEATIPALYYVSKLARQELKVVLAGQGADEPLAGYHRYWGESLIARYSWLLRLLPRDLLSASLRRNERIKRALYASRFSNELDRFLAIYTIFTPAQKASLLSAETAARIKDVDKSLVEKYYQETSFLKDSLSKMLHIDTRMGLPDNLLLFNDKITMANSLEMRVPFLDLDLVNFIQTLPIEYKLRGKVRKYVHKKAAQRWLPPQIINRPKRGFETPMDRWLQSDLADRTRELFLEKDSACRRFFNVQALADMVQAHKSGRENFSRHIFLILSFEVWYRNFFKEEQPVCA